MTATLDGIWRAAPADEALRRAFPSPEFDDEGWERLAVPGHWRSTPAFADNDDPVLYRRLFETDVTVEGRRTWLTFDGVFYDGDVWLDGSYVGATEGYFFPHTFEITDLVAARTDHVLAVEVGCSRPSDLTAKRNLTGVFQHGDALDPTWNPGGIWRPVRLVETGPVRISSLRVLCPEATAERALLTIRAVLDADAPTGALLRVTVADPTGETVSESITPHNLAHGDNRIRTQVAVEQPALWWPHALGLQPLHDVTVEVVVADPVSAGAAADEGGGHIRSDHRVVRTGLRSVRMKQWILTVNGERLFVKGSNQGPTRMALAEATADELEADILLARGAGLDLLRLQAHVGRPETYEAADRHGLLLWQDLPLRRGYARSVRKQGVRQAREAVDMLSHHPSIAVWCGHNEPLALGIEPATGELHPARFAALQTLPTWNKTVLDGSVSRALERADPTRPVVAHSGVFPGPLSGGTDTHLYCGWLYGTERDFARLLAAVPSLSRFVSEFGAQAVPSSAAFMQPDRWPTLDWAHLETHHSLQLANFDKHVPPGSHATFDAWTEATQAYQATILRHHIETLRRLKYRPTGGFCYAGFADGHPAVTWSVLDDQRNPKAGFDALVASCAPVIIVADRPAESYAPGADIALDVHVVSDLRRPLADLRVTATLGAWTATWGGEVPADGCVRVGTIRTLAPLIASQSVLELSLAGPDVSAHNTYTIHVGAPG